MIKVDSTESKVVEVATTLAKFSQVKPIVQRVVQWKIVNIQADELTSNTWGNKGLDQINKRWYSYHSITGNRLAGEILFSWRRHSCLKSPQSWKLSIEHEQNRGICISYWTIRQKRPERYCRYGQLIHQPLTWAGTKIVYSYNFKLWKLIFCFVCLLGNTWKRRSKQEGNSIKSSTIRSL